MKYQDRFTTGTVYLIHFHEKLCHAQHYIGFTTNLDERIQCHKNGNGSRLMEVIGQLELPWEVARTWENTPKAMERELKNYKNAKRLCPICSGEKAHNRKVEFSGNYDVYEEKNKK